MNSQERAFHEFTPFAASLKGGDKSETPFLFLQFSGCRLGRLLVYFTPKILIRYASRLAKDVAHRPARVCGLLIL